MTSWCERLTHLLGRTRWGDEAESGPRASDYAYTLYWTRRVRGWEAEQRRAIQAAVETIVMDPGFLPNENFRIYTVPRLDDSAHSGASLLALRRTLKAFDRAEQEGDLDD